MQYSDFGDISSILRFLKNSSGFEFLIPKSNYMSSSIEIGQSLVKMIIELLKIVAAKYVEIFGTI